MNKKNSGKKSYNDLGMQFKDGEFKKINFNIFIRHFLKKYKIIIDEHNTYYIYLRKYNFWQEINISTICKLARKMIHKEKDNIWKANYKREFKELLELEVKCINDKTKYNIDYKFSKRPL